jgi:DNA invertase Pin-like site-specific DNA recombinase
MKAIILARVSTKEQEEVADIKRAKELWAEWKRRQR